MGITDYNERSKLFKLIQICKREITPGSSAISSEHAALINGGEGAKPSSKAPAIPRKPTGFSGEPPSSGIPAPAPVSARPSSDALDAELMRFGGGGAAAPAMDRKRSESSLPPAGPTAPRSRAASVAAAPAPASVVGVGASASPSSQSPSPVPMEFEGKAGSRPGSKIKVAVRKRPRNSKEKARGEEDIAQVDGSVGHGGVIIHEAKVKVDLTKYVERHHFYFDEAFPEGSSNMDVYARTCKPLVSFLFANQGKCTCFAYGQTGSGKTFTMMGVPSDDSNSGLYLLAARDIFAMLRHPQYADVQVWVSFFEIYGGKLFDLLNQRAKLVMREDGSKNVNVIGLKEVRTDSVDSLFDWIARGNQARSTGSTGANIDSSRSHAILQLTLKKKDTKGELKMHGRFSFIDLAGSERAADTTNNDRRTRLEGAEINKSLLALKECIRALDQQSGHLPFRGSTLTQVLKDSFMGNSRTVMIANVSPNSGSCEHTLNTLRYADRVKELKSGGGSGPPSHNPYMPHLQQARPAGPAASSSSAAASSASSASSAASSPAGTAVAPSQIPVSGKRRPSGGGDRVTVLDDSVDLGAGPSAGGGAGASGSGSASGGAAGEESSSAAAFEGDLARTHTDLCSTILNEEDSIMEAHRASIDMTMKLIKEEVELLRAASDASANIDDYANTLFEIRSRILKNSSDFLSKLEVFRQHLKQEEVLSTTVKQRQKG